MNIAMVYLQDANGHLKGDIHATYSGSPMKYAGVLGDPSVVQHVEIPSDMDPRAVSAHVYDERWALLNGDYVYVDPNDEDAIHEAGTFIVFTEDLGKKGEVQKQDLIGRVRACREFGTNLADEFAAENVLLGVTQAGMTGTVLDRTEGLRSALSSGSLYEAIARARAIPAEHKDPIFITDIRLLSAINKIEDFLGVPRSEHL